MSGQPIIRPDFDTDCLWKQVKPNMAAQGRTISVDANRTMAGTHGGVLPNEPMEPQQTSRRFSLSGFIFGTPTQGGLFSGQGSSDQQNVSSPTEPMERNRSNSVTEHDRWKDIMREPDADTAKQGWFSASRFSP